MDSGTSNDLQTTAYISEKQATVEFMTFPSFLKLDSFLRSLGCLIPADPEQDGLGW